MGLLVWRGYSVRATKLSLPFVEADLARFDALSAVTFFNEVSVSVIRPSNREEAAAVAGAAPLLLIHTGWSLVCEAFVRRFQAYPDDEHIMGAAAAIGGQNVEFLRMYRDIHVNAVRYAPQVRAEFAANYLVRAPSLAERIDGDSLEPIPATAKKLIMGASAIIHGE